MSIDITDKILEFTENTKEVQDNKTVISRNTINTTLESAGSVTKKIKFKTPEPKTKSHIHLYFKVINENYQC